MKTILLIIMAFLTLFIKPIINNIGEDTNRDVFGSACGWGGATPEMRLNFYNKLGDDTVENANVIARWLNSDMQEKQLYAIEAAYCIEENSNYRFSKEVHERIDELAESLESANTCRGCIYDVETMKEVIRRIKKKEYRTCDTGEESSF